MDDFAIVSLESASDGNNTIQLSGPNAARVGDVVTYQFANAPSGSRWLAAGSFSNAGMVELGHVFDIGRPYTEIASGVAVQGGGSFQGTIPALLGGRIFYIEVGAVKASEVFDSNLIILNVQ